MDKLKKNGFGPIIPVYSGSGVVCQIKGCVFVIKPAPSTALFEILSQQESDFLEEKLLWEANKVLGKKTNPPAFDGLIILN